jgi:hypothetical protein
MNPRTQKASIVMMALLLGLSSCILFLHAQDSRSDRGGRSDGPATSSIYLPYAQFQIPFNIDNSGSQPSAVQLLVSTDEGATWQTHGRASPRARHFDFRAAAEGEYLFKVQTLDASGVAFPSPDQPLRVKVDTSKPQASIQADLDREGNLVVDLRVSDDHLDLNTAMIRLRTDRDPTWREVPVNTLSPAGEHFEGQVEILIPQCREVAIVFSIADMAKNPGEATLLFPMPRTAANPNELQLASTTSNEAVAKPSKSAISKAGDVVPGMNIPGANIPGAVTWNAQQLSNPKYAKPSLVAPGSSASTTPQAESTGSSQGNYPTTPRIIKSNDKAGPGQLAKSGLEIEVGPRIDPKPEELRLPDALAETQNESANDEIDVADSRVDQPYFCRSRTFSLDYSVEALGGNALSEVELWGTEDHGRTWQKWGSDPDRTSPFDVKVGNDGLFGFRMVLVGAGGTVLGNPKPGDDADAWIHIDSETPTCKITRAVYGVGSEAGMLVVDYHCADSDLSDQAISLSWSSSPEGPWTAVANGLKNTGLYLWKADPGLPNRVYMKLEAVDKAGNVGVHRLELPIDTKGLAPRGRIQGIRPIVAP